MASTSQTKAPSPWRSTAVLTLTALPAGAWFASATCYWQGRTFNAGDRFAPGLINWQPSLAPSYVVLVFIGIAWVVSWFLHARRTRRLGWPYVHPILPLAVFGFGAVVLSN